MKKMFLVSLLPFLAFGAEVQLSTLPVKDNCYTVEPQAQVTSYSCGEVFQIKPSEMFSVSFKAKSLCKPKEFGKIMAGFRQFAANGRRIYSAHVTYVKDSDAVLASAVAKGAKTIAVKNPVWKLDSKTIAAFNGVEESKIELARAMKLQTLVVVFGTDPDHKDLPNFTLNSSNHAVVKAIPQADGTVTVELKQPLKIGYAAGTNVRLHLWTTESDYKFACWPDSGLRSYKFAQSPKQWLPGAKSAQLIFSFSRRNDFKGLKIEMEKPVVKKIAEDGELF